MPSDDEDCRSEIIPARPGGTVLPPWLVLALPTAVSAALFAIRMTEPSDLLTQDQERPAAYVLDALRNGNWVIQTDQTGGVMSKPPLSTWLTASVMAPFERTRLVLLYLPCLLAQLGTVWLILGAGARHFGSRAALLGALTFVVSGVGYQQVALARTDSLFAMLVFLAAIAAYRAWARGTGWALFWCAATCATLTKGPVGLLFASGGLLATLWEKRGRTPRPIQGRLWPGLVLYLTICVGWALLAWLDIGHAFTDKMLGSELLEHAIGAEDRPYPLTKFYLPAAYFISRFAPWSIFAIWGLWRIWRRPARDDRGRRFERFLFCQLLAGVAVLSVASHQRDDLLWPMIPAASLLAGRELARLSARCRTWAILTIGVAVCAAGLALTVVYGHWVRGRTDIVASGERLRQEVASVRGEVGLDFPFVHHRTPYAAQFHLGSMSREASIWTVRKALSRPCPVFVMMIQRRPHDWVSLPGKKVYEIRRWAFRHKRWGPHKEYDVRIVSNRPRLAYTDPICVSAGDCLIELSGLRPLPSPRGTLLFRARSADVRLDFDNNSKGPVAFDLRVVNTEPELAERVSLPPGGTCTVERSGLTWSPDRPFLRLLGRIAIGTGLYLAIALGLALGGLAAIRAVAAGPDRGAPGRHHANGTDTAEPAASGSAAEATRDHP